MKVTEAREKIKDLEALELNLQKILFWALNEENCRTVKLIEDNSGTGDYLTCIMKKSTREIKVRIKQISLAVDNAEINEESCFNGGI